MGKTYVGSRLRQLRRDYDLSQASLAATLGLSASYVNQIEHDVRPLTDPVLDRITSAFDVDATFFSRDDNSRLLAEVQDAMLDKDLNPTPVDARELAELVDNHPAIARAVVAMHQRYRNTRTALACAASRSPSCVSTAPETSPNVNPPPASTSHTSAAPAPCGTCTTLSPPQDASCASWHTCPTAAPTCG